MASTRTMYVGDNSPPMKGQASDETGVLNLSGRTLECICVGQANTFSGPAAPIWPPEDDADGVHRWNWEYDFATDDSAVADLYDVFLRVEWAPGATETFGMDTLEVKALA